MEEDTHSKHADTVNTLKKDYEERMSQFQLLYLKEEKQRKKAEKDLE
jgi:hypothetical protein